MPPKVFRGERLRQLRESRSLTLHALSEQTGIGINQLQRYTTGEVDPSPYQIKRLAATFGVSADYFLGLTDTPTKQVTSTVLTVEELRFLQDLREGRLIYLTGTTGQTVPDEHEQAYISPRPITAQR